MESMKNPKRVVLRFHVEHECEEAAINKRFLALHGPDYTHPTIDNNNIEYEVFKVKKKVDLYVIVTLKQSIN
jgi:hypothetical protein